MFCKRDAQIFAGHDRITAALRFAAKKKAPRQRFLHDNLKLLSFSRNPFFPPRTATIHAGRTIESWADHSNDSGDAQEGDTIKRRKKVVEREKRAEKRFQSFRGEMVRGRNRYCLFCGSHKVLTKKAHVECRTVFWLWQKHFPTANPARMLSGKFCSDQDALERFVRKLSRGDQECIFTCRPATPANISPAWKTNGFRRSKHL